MVIDGKKIKQKKTVQKITYEGPKRKAKYLNHKFSKAHVVCT